MSFSTPNDTPESDVARARKVARDALQSGDALTRATAAGALATARLHDALAGVDARRANDRATVEGVLSVVRQGWQSPREELDALYETLRQYGHEV